MPPQGGSTPLQGVGGSDRDRTCGLYHVKIALSRLSYRPIRADTTLHTLAGYGTTNFIGQRTVVLYKWSLGDSNPRPSACKADALPTELRPQNKAAWRPRPNYLIFIIRILGPVARCGYI